MLQQAHDSDPVGTGVDHLIPYEDASFQRSHWKLVSGATAGYISDGYTLGVVGIALAAAQTQLQLTPAWLGAIGSSLQVT